MERIATALSNFDTEGDGISDRVSSGSAIGPPVKAWLQSKYGLLVEKADASIEPQPVTTD